MVLLFKGVKCPVYFLLQELIICSYLKFVLKLIILRMILCVL